MRLFHGALEFCHVFWVGSGDVYFVHLHLLVLVDVDIHQHAVVARHVLALRDVHLAVFEALLHKVLLDVVLGAVHHVGGDLVAGLKADNLFAVLAFRLFNAGVSYARYAWLCGEFDVQVSFAVDNAVGHNLNVRKDFLVPIASHGLADVGPGNFVGVAHVETRYVEQVVVVVAFHLVHGEASQHIARVVGRVGDDGLVVVVVTLCGLCLCGGGQRCGHSHQDEQFA